MAKSIFEVVAWETSTLAKSAISAVISVKTILNQGATTFR